ncbi:MAG: divalent-cation tolerance protein CutA [Bacteroidota bacterium]
MSLRTLYITCRDLEEAQSIAKTVVKERLAACGNILPGMQSVYHWEGKVVEDSEVVLLLKTRVDLVDTLTKRVKELHSYDIPCIVSWIIDGGNKEYLNWIAAETQQ